MNTTQTKVAARILAALDNGAPTLRVATQRAAFAAVQEGKALGWSEKTLAGVVAAFINTAIDMAEGAAAEVAA